MCRLMFYFGTSWTYSATNRRRSLATLLSMRAREVEAMSSCSTTSQKLSLSTWETCRPWRARFNESTTTTSRNTHWPMLCLTILRPRFIAPFQALTPTPHRASMARPAPSERPQLPFRLHASRRANSLRWCFGTLSTWKLSWSAWAETSSQRKRGRSSRPPTQTSTSLWRMRCWSSAAVPSRCRGRLSSLHAMHTRTSRRSAAGSSSGEAARAARRATSLASGSWRVTARRIR
mmetsp:Transcript_85129/g.231071  ORF Transcript_85129/g.231071 Transcript_85129/m.231071 type:complete len:233 (+) Transcript_85129:933-1631(+)